ncbi:MAG: SGNH/GDSL hydrolase family protein [Ruminococcaceae bacterium]|nr:SGNH/GDSL hydrolase family protein [Oscillospiraceae bacterium]
MKKIALLGDSIRLLGYGQKVAEMLSPECEVWQPDDNCRFAAYTLRGLFEWKENLEGCDVIHWNNGLWDICDLFGDGPFTSLEVYVDTMKRIARILQTYSKKVVFATMTPVTEENPYNSNEVIKQFNEAVVPELEKMGVIINDLHKIVWDNLEEYMHEDTLHLSQKGNDACAEQVCEIIKANL